MKKELAIFGLGKMGSNLARNLSEKGWKVVGWNRTPEVIKSLSQEVTKSASHKVIKGAYTIHEVMVQLKKPRVVWLMVPNGKPVDQLLFGNEGVTKYLH